MSTASRVFRALGSLVFIGAGLSYIFLPPNSTIHAFDSRYPALVYGVVFVVGGVISMYGTLARFSQIERFGVVLVVIASAILTTTQALIMLDAPPTWTRLGGVLVYGALTIWAFERWWRLGSDVKAIADLPRQEH